jgi:hypothetical protein
MNAWRMALRAGFRGSDLRQDCEREGVAVVTFESIKNIDLSRYTPDKKPRTWHLKGSAPASMINFAWRICGGDLIFVRDSMRNNHMVAAGVVKGALGDVAYRFDRDSQIKRGRTVWRHKIDVSWDRNFVEFQYHDRSPNSSVLRLNDWEFEQFGRYTSRVAKRSVEEAARGRPEQERQIEDVYPRISPELKLIIKPLHRELANTFAKWLRLVHGITAVWERKQIDMMFDLGASCVLAELKIAYGGNTRNAIREAIGQILEYNHYPGRTCFDEWLLILDQSPSSKDLQFIQELRARCAVPLTLGWKSGETFLFHPKFIL